MKSDKDAVYFLTVQEAEEIAGQHDGDEDWDIWEDQTAIEKAEAKEEAEKAAKTRRAS